MDIKNKSQFIEYFSKGIKNHNIKGIIALENPEKLEIVMESVDLE